MQTGPGTPSGPAPRTIEGAPAAPAAGLPGGNAGAPTGSEDERRSLAAGRAYPVATPSAPPSEPAAHASGGSSEADRTCTAVVAHETARLLARAPSSGRRTSRR